MLQQVSTSSNPLLFGYSNNDSIDDGTQKEEEPQAPPPEEHDPKKLVEIIRRLNNQNITLENRFDQLNEQYQISKEQIRELHLALRHTNKTSREDVLQNLEARDGDTRRFNHQIGESAAKVFVLEDTVQQLQTDIKNYLADFRNKEKHHKKEIKQLKAQFEEDKYEVVRGCKAEIESIQALKQKEVSETKLEYEQLRVSLERIHQNQIADLKREAIIQSKKLNKKLTDLKVDIEKQRKVAKADAIRMQETIQAAKTSMVRKTFGESSGNHLISHFQQNR
jgi:DNA repair exonuclease SbcCD ATPase subunit